MTLRYLDKARVRNLMTAEVVTLTVRQSLPLAESLMRMKRIRHLPVVDEEGTLVGLVTHRDLLRAKLSDLSGLTEEERRSHEGSVPVSSIMQTNTWTVAPDTLASSAANLLRDHHFGCLPVVESGKLVGIVTEADFVDAVVLGGRDAPLPAPGVADAMTRHPHTIKLPATVGDARALMEEHGIRHLPLESSGALVGMISDRDLRVADGIAGGAKGIALGLIGSDPIYFVEETTPLHVVLDEMADGRRGSAMVTRDGELVGILTTVDACRYLAAWLRAQFVEA